MSHMRQIQMCGGQYVRFEFFSRVAKKGWKLNRGFIQLRASNPEANESKHEAVAITVASATSCVGSTSTRSIARTRGCAPHSHATRRNSYGVNPPGREPGVAGAKIRSSESISRST